MTLFVESILITMTLITVPIHVQLYGQNSGRDEMGGHRRVNFA